MTTNNDPRRRVPRTDSILADSRLASAIATLGQKLVKAAVVTAQGNIRAGLLQPDKVVEAVLASMPQTATSFVRVVNASGILLHTNLGRAPLSTAAREALLIASGTTDVEIDLETGRRGIRGAGVLSALIDAVPSAQAALVVNNGAAALVLVAAVLSAGREIVISRGELVEIGDGFRLPDLLRSTGATLREVGTTNRTTLDDYRESIGPETGMILKVHPSNFMIVGFTADVPVDQLATLGAPVVVDIGSGLLATQSILPEEPDAESMLVAGADLVTASGDKLLGGPQAGLLLGRADLINMMRRHPLARALRVDKLTLAALEATLRGPNPPVIEGLTASVASLDRRAESILERSRKAQVDIEVTEAVAMVGGGGAPGVELRSVALVLPEWCADALRSGEPSVLCRVEAGRCLLDLRSVRTEDDALVVAALLRLTMPH